MNTPDLVGQEPLSAEEEALIRQFAFTDERTSILQTAWGRTGIKRLLATLDAARSRPDEARLREALRLARQQLVQNTLGIDPMLGHVLRKIVAALARPAVPVAAPRMHNHKNDGEYWQDCPGCDDLRSALRATHPEDDGTDTWCPLPGVHEHAFRGPHHFREWDPTPITIEERWPAVTTPDPREREEPRP
jgi:hypothetical protein